MFKNIHVVINPASGQPEPVLHTLNQVFLPEGIDWDNSVTQEAGDATHQVVEAVEGGVDLVAVYGGDGTVMEAANGLIGSEVPMLVLPGGTGNVFSIEIGIPQDLRAAVELAINPESEIRPVDVGKCGKRHFLLRVGIGFVAEQVQLTSRELRDRYGKLAYFIAAMHALPTLEPARYNFEVDGEQLEYEGAMCLVENAGNIGLPDTSLVPDIHVDDGKLDLVVLRGIDIQTALSALSSITGGEPQFEHLAHRQGCEFSIRSDPPQKVVVDGEPYGETPCHIQVDPGAISVLVPGLEEASEPR